MRDKIPYILSFCFDFNTKNIKKYVKNSINY